MSSRKQEKTFNFGKQQLFLTIVFHGQELKEISYTLFDKYDEGILGMGRPDRILPNIKELVPKRIFTAIEKWLQNYDF